VCHKCQQNVTTTKKEGDLLDCNALGETGQEVNVYCGNTAGTQNNGCFTVTIPEGISATVDSVWRGCQRDFADLQAASLAAAPLTAAITVDKITTGCTNLVSSQTTFSNS
jgi:hypothetical protein